MRINIAERLRPFSHLPGTSFVLPGSALSLEIFPTVIRVNDISTPLPYLMAEITLDFKGPVKGFTTILDLEKGCLHVFGEGVDGYFRYHITALEKVKGIEIYPEKAPALEIPVWCIGRWTSTKPSLNAGERIIFSEKGVDHSVYSLSLPLENLSLGSHKLQDWELVRRRMSFAEIFPVWFRLGQMVPKPLFEEFKGTAFLLEECHEAIAANAPEKILISFRNLFLAGFTGVLSPQLIDMNYHGINYPAIEEILDSKASASLLLTEGAKLIKSLFIQENGSNVAILPSLPPEFHCGRLLGVKCGDNGRLSIEWTKKSVRCMTFVAEKDQKLSFIFSNHEKCCRLRTSNKDRGVSYQPGSQLDIVAGQQYWFDNFER